MMDSGKSSQASQAENADGEKHKAIEPAPPPE